MGRAGRKRKQGERKPSGDLKQSGGEAIAPAVWQRIRTHSQKFFSDPRIASEISRLSMLRELTDAQCVAAFRIGEIYHRYYRAKRLRIVPKSPNYEGSSLGSADLAEERMSDDQLAAHEVEIKRAEAAWRKMNDSLGELHGDLRQTIYDLCVLNVPINPTRLRDVRKVLDAIALRLNDDRRGVKTLPKLGLALKGSSADPQQVAAAIPRQADAQLSALEAVVRRLRDDLGDEDMVQIKQVWLALVDRYRFRATKH